MIFGRKRKSATALDERDPDAILAEIEELSTQNRAHRDPDLERRILALRWEAGAALAGKSNPDARFPEPSYDNLPAANGSGLPETTPEALTPELVRAALLRDGALIVRGAVGREQALRLADEIETAVAVREGTKEAEGFYEPFELARAENLQAERQWVTVGGLWAADSPKLMFDMLEALRGCGLDQVIRGYLGETPAISIQKCTMRKVNPDSGSGWHQDGAFLGDVRALNVWMSLSRCGDVAPGMDIVSKRLTEIVPTGTEGAAFDWSVAQDVVDGVAGPDGIVRPIFEPGDVLLFDEMNLHATAADPSMPNPRYAVESWFFGLSGFPSEYVPIAC